MNSKHRSIKRHFTYFGLLCCFITTVIAAFAFAYLSFRPEQSVLQFLTQQIVASILVMLIAFFLMMRLSTRLHKMISQPIQKMAEHAQYIINTNDFSQSIEPKGSQETVHLGENFNDMLKYIRENDDLLEEKILDRTKELSDLNKQFKYLAYHDALTLLPNRTLFHDRLDLALAHAERTKKHIALLYLDLDRFKNINDTLGHHFGDELLKQVSQRLLKCVRKDDTVARLGGDEFVVLLTNLNESADAGYVANEILISLQSAFVLEANNLYTSTSIGISIFPNDANTSIELQRNADTAMYHAKEEGRNNFQYYSEELNLRTQKKLLLENELNRALLNDEFVIHYQPQYNTLYNRIVGFEALVRWQHPEKGLIFPDEFIPFAEEIGLITEIDRWVLRHACDAVTYWNDEYPYPLTISVNLAVDNFKKTDLLQSVNNVLEETGLDASLLELEITEGSIMGNTDEAKKILEDIKLLGIGIALDDFGTGYSSLSYLKSFPFDTIKIDKSFVQDSIVDPEDAAIIRAIVAMAQSLNLRVIAEGVETEEQLRFLQALICHNIQGYYYSKPLPSEKVMEFLKLDLQHSQELKMA